MDVVIKQMLENSQFSLENCEFSSICYYADEPSALQLFGVVSYEVIIRITFGNKRGRCAPFFKIVETLEVFEILMIAVNSGFVFFGVVIILTRFV